MNETKSERRWIAPGALLPRDGQKVEWLTSTGERVDGVYHGRLWFFADMSMYVYYTPTFWRERD